MSTARDSVYRAHALSRECDLGRRSTDHGADDHAPALSNTGRSGRKASRDCDWPDRLLDDLDDAVCARIDKDRSAIDYGVAIIANSVLLRDVIVGYAIARQIRAHPHVTVI
ncbi:hypothetical protein BraRD5C2_35490 [Bradyrhizobium sp. RD5-C2]|nr:hypothetical protein BraRD5C2_35490 [Bradyrhizobium sp. RD5-C2]